MNESKALLILQKDIDGLALRIRDLMPGGNRLSIPESLALAQVALIHGLDPFNGEIWYLKKKDGTPIGIMAGIKGHRRAARVQLEREGGGAHWCEFDLLDHDEKASLSFPDNALAFRCRLFDSVNLRSYSETIERMMKAGMPWEEVRGMLGARPYNVGYGYYTPGEQTMMKPAACAMKRAEADALKRRFDLPFGTGVGQSRDDDGDSAVDADYSISQAQSIGGESSADIQERINANRQAASAALYGDPEQDGPDLATLDRYDISPQDDIALIMTQVKNQGGQLYVDDEGKLRIHGYITDTLKELVKAKARELAYRIRVVSATPVEMEG